MHNEKHRGVPHCASRVENCSLKIYLVRHGESAWNVKHIYTGQQDVSLSERGALQVERVAEKFAGIDLQAIYASPLKRAHDTARPTARWKDIPLRLDARLAEIHHGAWEGNPAAVIREQYADEYRAWRTQPHRMKMPEGESLADVSFRVQSFLQDSLNAHHDGNILIVTHDAVLRVIILQTLQMSLEFFWRWRFDNASVSMVEWVGTEPGSVPIHGEFRLALLNDVHHLIGVHTNCDAQAL